jgi:hypothetical protein
MTKQIAISLLLLTGCMFLSVRHGFSQTLTISSSGQTGTSGTNWSISGNTLTVTGTANIQAAVIQNHLTGNSLSIVGNTNSLTVNVNEAVSSATAGNGLTLGATTNTGAVTISSAISLAGPITVNGGSITLNSNLTSTSATADIGLYAKGNFGTGTSTRRTISTGGGDIYVVADSDANGNGVLNIDYLTLNPGTGDIILRTENFNWVTTNTSDKPYLNGTGNITIESSDASLGQDINTTWFAFDQDANGIGAITVGKTTNADLVFIAGAAITAAGPVSFYGSTLEMQTNLTTTAGEVLFKFTNNIVVFDGKAITTNGNDVIFWADSDASGSATVAGGVIYVGNGSSVLTGSGAGDIVMGGGADNGGRPGGYAIGQYGLGGGYYGLIINNSTLNAGMGNVTLRGQGSAGFVDYAIGMRLEGGSLTGANITIDAIGSIRGASSNWGLQMNSFDIFGSGDINITGTGGRAGASNADVNQRGIYMYGNSLVQASGSGNITLTGIGGGGTFAQVTSHASNVGILLDQANPALTTAGGTITINGTSGRNGNGPGMVLGAPISANGDVFLNGFKSISGTSSNGNIEINGALSAVNADVNINSPGAVTQTAAITADGLALTGTGAHTLNNTSNNVVTIAGGSAGAPLASLSYIDGSGGLTIGTINPTGITATGSVIIETVTGNINLQEDITTASTSPSAILLNAGKGKAAGDLTGGDIIVSGTPALTTGAGGAVLLFSGSETNSTGLSALASSPANIQDNVDENTTFSPALSAGTTHVLYRYGLGSLGNLSIVASGGDAIGTTWDYAGGFIRPTGAAASKVNSAEVESYLATGDLTIHAGLVTFSDNVNSTSSNNLTIWSNTHINNTAATTITTQGGDVLFASNINDATDNESTTNGYIQMRGGLTIQTNGGDITLGGGNEFGSNYALGTSLEDQTEGIRIDLVLSLNSGGGNIILRGKSYSRAVQTGWGASGIGFYFLTALGTIQSGTGTITLDGYSQTWGSSFSSGIYVGSPIQIISSNTTANAIRLLAKATGTSGEAWGIETDNTFTVMATGSGGGITLSTSQLNASNNYDAVFRGETNILAAGGPIQLLGGESGGIANGILFFNNNNIYLGSKAATAVAASSSDLTIQYDRYSFNNFRPRISTTGSVLWKSVSTSFGAAVNTDWFLWNQNSQTLNNLTIGTPSNTATVEHWASTLAATGAINIYGGAVVVNSNLSTTSPTADIGLYAKGNFGTGTSTRRTISTGGGDIYVVADSDANGNGVLDVDYLTFNPGAGDIILRAETFGFAIGATEKPYLNGTGNFILESSDASFGQDIGTTWFGFDQDANGIGAITLGKTTNAYIVFIDGAAITAAGPVSAYGSNVEVKTNLTTMSGEIFFKVTNNIVVYDGKAITTNGNDVIFWADSDASGSATAAGGVIYVGNGSSVLTGSGAGDIVMGGGADNGGRPGGYAIGQYGFGEGYYGLIINNSTLNAGTGNVILRGQGSAGFVNYAIGMRLEGGSLTGANITIDAIGSIRGYSSNWGLQMNSFDIFGSGDINITGTGGRAGASNADVNQRGIFMYGNSLIQASGSGSISLTGIGGGGTLAEVTSHPSNIGILLDQANTALTTAGGTITINGTSGRNGNGPGMVLGAPISANGDVFLNGFKSTSGTSSNGNIEIKGALSATNADVIINSPGAVSQTAAITANGLALTGTGAHALNNTSNNVVTLAGGSAGAPLASLSYTDGSGGLTIGSVNPTGITATGAVTIETVTGNINLQEDITTASTSTGAILLNAGKGKVIGDPTGGDIIVSGTPALTTGAGGVVRMFSGSEVNSTGLTTLAGGSANVREGVDETTATFSPALSADNKYALYRFSLELLGDLTIVDSGGDALNSTWTYDNGMLRPIGIAAATVNASEVVSYLATANLEVRAGNININGSITSSSTNALIYKTKGNIIHNAGKSFTGAGGDLVYWADLDGASGGRIALLGNISTNGGDFYAGGGSASETIGSLTVPTGYAGNTAANNNHGVTVNGCTINTAGGDLRIKGSINAVNGTIAGVMVSNASILTGDGDLSLIGLRTGDPWESAGLWIGVTIGSGSATGNVVISSTGGDITLEGVAQATDTYNWNVGLAIVSTGTDNITISSGSGNISMSGNASTAAAYAGEALGLNMQTNAGATPISIRVTTDGGAITLTGVSGNGSDDYGMALRASEAPGNIIIGDENSGNVTLNFNYFQTWGRTTLGVTAINSGGAISVQPVSADWPGNIILFDELSFGSNATSLTIGPAAGTRVVTLRSPATIAGPISVYGGQVNIDANVTSSADGDIFLQGNNSANTSVYISSGRTLTKSGGSGTLTLKGKANTAVAGTVTTSGSGVLNVVLWSDYDGTRNDGGAAIASGGSISTNGGHFWMGGTASAGGSDTWNGLQVGNGPSIGSYNYNYNALDLFGNITTNGGDILIWGGSGYGGGVQGIGSGNSPVLNTGSGDITLIADDIAGPAITIRSTGHFTFRPHTAAWANVAGIFDFAGSVSSNTYTGSGDADCFKIENMHTLGGLTLGHPTTTSGIKTYANWSIAGPMNFYGGNLEIGANLTSTLSGADILMKATGRIDVSGGSGSGAYRTIQTNNGDIVLWSNAAGSTSGSITIGDWSTLNSANGQISQSAGGGKVWLAGGTEVNGEGLPTGPAIGTGLTRSGVTFGSFSGGATTTSVYSGGGDIFIHGETSAGAGNGLGISWNRNLIANAGNGTITIKGLSKTQNTWHGVELGAYSGSTSLIAGGGDATTPAIRIEGSTERTSGGLFGVLIGGGSLQATGAGGISIVSSASAVSATESCYFGGVDLLSASGDILVSAQGGTGLRYGGTLGKKTGTQVTASSSNITLRSNQITVNSGISVDATGVLVVEPFSASFTSALAWPIASFTTASGLTGMRLGKETNTADITINGAQTTSGYISLYGGNIAVDQNLNTTAGGAAGDVLLKGSGNVTLAAGKSITTDDGDAIFWSDSDADGSGFVQLNANAAVSTSGGKIAMGGGTDIATGYARGAATRDTDTEPTFNLYISGVHLKSGVNLSSDGGDITLRGQNSGGSTSALSFGVMGANATLDAGTGKITINGLAGGSSLLNAQAISVYNSGWTLRSANTTAQAITLEGDASLCNGSVTSLGINFAGTIEATGTGGGILLKGVAGTATSDDIPMGFNGSALASSGDITLIGENNNATQGGLFIQGDLGFKSATNVTSSSSNIILKGDQINFNGSTALNTSGSVSILPLDASNSFGSTQTFGSNMALHSTVSGLTIGKATNTANITLSGANTVAGPVTIYGGDIALNGALTVTNDDINLHATGNVTQTAAITADGLGLHGTGSFILTDTGNNIDTLAGGDNSTLLGSLSLVDASGGLTIGSVNPTGIKASGDVLIETLSGDIELTEPISTTSNTNDLTGYTGAIVLNAGKSSNVNTATGGDIVVSGNGSVLAPNGIVKLYSGSDDNSTGLTSLVGGSAQKRISVDETTVSFSPALTAGGKFALYRVAALCAAGPASSTPTLCVNTALTDITHATTNATGIGTAAGLPNGLTASWNADQITISGTPTESGTFNYSIPLAGGCGSDIIAKGSIIVKEAPAADISVSETAGSADDDGTICAGSSATLTASGGTSYDWGSSSSAVQVVSPATTTVYSVTVTATDGCTAVATETITVNALPVPAITVTATPDCPMGDSGALSATVDPDWTYLWSNDSTTTSISNLVQGLYSLTVTDENGCEGTASENLVDPFNMSITVNKTDVTCNGENTGEISVTVNGGTPSYTYAWSSNAGGATGPMLSNLAAGSYSLTVTESGANSCQAVTSIKIAEPAHGITATVNISENSAEVADDGILCSGDMATLSAVVTPTPGATIDTYAWNDSSGSMTSSISASSAGTYTVTVNDTKGCSTTASYAVSLQADNTVGAPSATPTVCIDVAMSNITHSTTGATGIGTATGLPAGVTASWAGNAITIGGTPTESGEFNYSIPLTGGCGSVNATGTITVTPANTAGMASASPTLCNLTELTDITHATTGATGIGAATGLPAGLTASWASDLITISGTPTEGGTFIYSIPLTGGCGSPSATGIINVTPLNEAGAASETPNLCVNTALNDITHATSRATGIGTATGLPDGVTATWASDLITISGMPTESGVFNYSIPLTGGCGDIFATGTIAVNPPTSAGTASATPELCINTALTDITHTTISATGIGSPTGLPAGVTAAWAADVITISGTPTQSGTFNYSIPLTGICGSANATGTITVNLTSTIGAASSTPTLCINTALTDITHAVTIATGIGTPTGLPNGVTASYTTNLITISGTPTESGTFNYNIPLTGGCGSESAMGTITVTPDNTVGAASATPSLCINTELTSITHTTTGATGIGTPAGLPAGVTAAWAANLIAISGTPAESGVFNYSIPLSGGCGSLSATGTITVNAVNVAGPASATPTLCANTVLTSITHTTTGATGIGSPTGLPAGVTAAWSANLITISGTPTESGVFNYSIPLTGGCGNISAKGSLTVKDAPNAAIAVVETSGTANDDGTICSGSSVNLTASGGSSYDWGSESSAIITASPTATTVYSVTVTNAEGCTAVVSETITVHSKPAPEILSITNPDCPMGATGTASATSEANWTYQWSHGATTASVTGLVQGLYSLTVTDLNGCEGTTSMTLEDPFNMTINVTKTDVNCYGANTGDISVTISGGEAPYTYSWSANAGGATGATLSNLAAGNYSLTVTEGGPDACQAVTSIDITEPEYGVQAVVTISENSGVQSDDGTICQGDMATLSASATPAPGGASISGYLWNNASMSTTGSISAGNASTYTVTVTDSEGCMATASYTLSFHPDNTAGAASSTPTLCLDSELSIITHTTTGATGIGVATGLPAGVSAAWSSDLITISGTPTESGTFNYSIPLTGGCGSVNATGTIMVTPYMTAGLASATPTLCINSVLTDITHATTGATGIGTATGLPAGVSASWASDQITISGTPSESGTFNYSIPLTGGCGSAEAKGYLTVKAAPLAYIDVTETAGAADDDGTICAGDAATLTAGGGSTYSWGSESNAILVVSPATTTSYSVTVTAADGCTAVATETITVNTLPAPAITASSGPDCPMAQTGSATATNNANWSYLWSNGSSNYIATDLVQGLYTLTVTDENGCEGTTSVTLSDPFNMTINVSKTDVTCYGKNTGAISVNVVGGTPGYAYAWSSNAVGATGSSISHLAAGNYSLTVTESGVYACQAVTSIDITEPDYGVAATASISENSGVQANDGIICPGDMATLSASATASPGATLSSYLWSDSPMSTGSSISVGATATYTVTVSDSKGCTATASYALTAADNVLPTALCQDVTVYLDAMGTGSTTAAAVDNYSSDACGIDLLSLSQTSFDCDDIGINAVTLTVTDQHGNSNSCNATVKVVDNTSPVVQCQDVTVYLDANGVGSTTAHDIDISNIACGIASQSLSKSDFACADIGDNAVTLTVTANNGKSGSCTATVTVADNTNPTALCQDVTVYLDATGSASIATDQVDNGSKDPCGLGTLSLDISSFSCAEVGNNTVTLTVPDLNGNSSTCTATVTVFDDTDPVAVCQDVTVSLDATGNGIVTAAEVDNGSSDACALGTMSLDITSFTCSDLGDNTVILTVPDVNGNSSTCTATVTVVDDTDPAAICQDVSVTLDATGSGSITVADVDNSSTDACGLGTLSLDITSFTCSEVGDNTVTLTVPDVNGNSSSCTATATVVDDTDPVAVCQDVTVVLDATGSGSITAAEVDNGSKDVCGLGTLSLDSYSFTCSDLGSNTVTLSVPDVNGNSSTCTSTVTVVDNAPPVAICQDLMVNLDAAGNGVISAAEVNNNSSDNCGIASLSLSQTSFTAANIGNNTVALTVTDGSGNSAICTATVMVGDNVPPIAVCQNVTIYLDVTGEGSTTAVALDNGSSDVSGIKSLVLSQTDFNCAEVGDNIVTLTVTDNYDNVNTCTATVAVVDDIAPVALCVDAVVSLDASGNGIATTAAVNNNSTDACGIATLSLSKTSFNCTEVGYQSVTLTVTDLNSNSSTCLTTLKVADNVPPIASCQPATVLLNAAGSGSLTTAAVNNNSTDACGIAGFGLSKASFNCADLGTNTVVLTVTDINGNASTCTAAVTVVDQILPVALCKNTKVFLDAAGQATLTASQVNNGSSDACGIAAMSVSPSSFNCANTGNNPVVLTVQDVSGNIKTCNAVVSVVDKVPPVPVCQNITLPLQGATALVPALLLNTAASFDNCGVVTPVSVAPSLLNCINAGNNTVVLTVSDGNGNTATCQSVVTVTGPEVNYTVTPEDCGQSNGSISIATTGGFGQPGYSINGGQSFQFIDSFAGLTSGQYVAVVAFFGGSGCVLPPVPVVVTANDFETNTWTGGGDGLTWSDKNNWSKSLVPQPCHEVVIPSGHNVLIPGGVTALGRTLFVDLGSELSVDPSAVMQIQSF